MKYIICISVLAAIVLPLFSQDETVDKIEYSADFKFKEGVYLNFEQVKNNSPLMKSRIISNRDYSDPEFFDNVLKKDKFFFYDNLGNRMEAKTKKVWGYSRNGFLYVQMDDGFFRITLIGSICHFVASQTSYSNAYSPYYSGGYRDPYYRHPSSTPNTEIRQYLLDFKEGRILDYTNSSMEILLMSDPTLHDEYVALRNKKKKQFRFMYIRKFNHKHPLYFPKK